MNDSLIDQSDDLNLSWVDEDERLTKINQNYLRENMKYIYSYCIYINKNNSIDKITSSVQQLETIGSATIGLTKETLIHCIKTNRIDSFELVDILLYNVTLEPENIQGFSKIESVDGFLSQFLTKHNGENDILIPPSIFIFHNLNSIYFIFKEVAKDSQDSHGPSSIKSSSKKTKKVTIQLPIKRNNQTKKYHDSE